MSFDYFQRAKGWHERALKEEDDFVKFILLYISLEVSIKQNLKKIRDLKRDENLKKNFMAGIQLQVLNELKEKLDKKPLKNENPEGDNRWSGKLIDSNDFDGIIEFIIRARNNLFHGDKGLDEERDIFIVKWGNILLLPLLNAILK